MFARLFGPRPIKRIDNSKTIERVHKEQILQSIWTKFLINIDLKISPYYDYDKDIILLSSPFQITNITNALHEQLDTLHLVYITSILIEYLFGNKKEIESKLQFTKIQPQNIDILFKNMSIIIIDIQSNQIIKLPMYSTDLSSTNSFINNISSYNDINNWKLRWSIKESTSECFQNIMNNICNELTNDNSVGKYFEIYKGKPSSLTHSISKLRESINLLNKREIHIESKIQEHIQRAKGFCKKRDQKNAIAQLKRKKLLEKQLDNIQSQKLNIETQIMCLEDSSISDNPFDFRQPTHYRRDMYSVNDDFTEDIIEQMDMVQEMNEAMNQPIGIDDDELEAELCELDGMDETLDELEAELCELEDVINDKPSDTLLVNNALEQSEMDELAKLEAMMN